MSNIGEHPGLSFYYRDGCHLCEDMWQHLQSIRETHPFDVDLINVDSDPDLRARYGTLIPVLASGEEIICNYYLDPVGLERFLSGLPDSE
ncbi:glutaredoxin family protein [Sedimenticola sp.]|uniref:glutaredoxin family protein n=1 Tax=Sedimenticola sp. TaxID=1940285 RepID=UPI0025892FC1|nr:glutaredoxin family protein [Sedimenticola sp.]MCW8902188.1 glutaredoxin family protein [Sedimenticola sp.]